MGENAWAGAGSKTSRGTEDFGSRSPRAVCLSVHGSCSEVTTHYTTVQDTALQWIAVHALQSQAPKLAARSTTLCISAKSALVTRSSSDSTGAVAVSSEVICCNLV